MWWVYALGSALIWGLHYNFISKLSGTLSPISIYMLPNVLLFLTTPLWLKTVVADMAKLFTASTELQLTAIVMMVTSITGTLCVYLAVRDSNAVMASLIEISYPLFVAIFGYLLYKDHAITMPIIIGGAFILCGVAIITIGSTWD